MSAQEFILIRRENYLKKQQEASEMLDDPTITAKSQQLTLLQRFLGKKPEWEKLSQEVITPNTREIFQKPVLRSITMLNPHQTEKSKSLLEELQSSSEVSTNDECVIEIEIIPIAYQTTKNFGQN